MNWSLITACNNDALLRSCLAASPAARSVRDFQVMRGFASASAAYNAGMRQTGGDILVFAHQDVYLPEGWDQRLFSAVAPLAEREPAWAVLGVFGITRERKPHGHVFCTGLQRVLGRDFTAPVECDSLDEIILVLRRSAGLTFDEGLPGYHLYGTDICLEARRRGLKSYIVPGFCLHNTEGLIFLPGAFWRAYFYMRRKWWSQLPVKTPCTLLCRSAWPVLEHPLRSAYSLLVKRERPGRRISDPAGFLRTIATPQTNSQHLWAEKQEMFVPLKPPELP
jgi:GT2 family glycosyltransferase